MKLRTILFILVIGMLASSCAPKEETGSGSSSVMNLSSAVPAIQVPTYPITLGAFQTYQFTPRGGVAPYHYRLQQGPGYVDYSAGLFQATSTSCNCIIDVMDSSGLSTTVTINVIGTATTSPPPSTTPTGNVTNCAAMLQAPMTAATDNTSNGVGLAIGAANIGDPSSCASWCGMNRAAFCLWSPGGTTATNPVCVAWPGGVTLSVYKTTWNAYAGGCQ